MTPPVFRELKTRLDNFDRNNRRNESFVKLWLKKVEFDIKHQRLPEKVILEFLHALLAEVLDAERKGGNIDLAFVLPSILRQNSHFLLQSHFEPNVPQDYLFVIDFQAFNNYYYSRQDKGYRLFTENDQKEESFVKERWDTFDQSFPSMRLNDNHRTRTQHEFFWATPWDFINEKLTPFAVCG